MNRRPKLRTVEKARAPFPLNEFPKDFPLVLGREIVYLLASKGKPTLEGKDWESIFVTCIGAEWHPSNVGLDDVILGNTAWGAKTVKSPHPSKTKKVRLISGRNSPVYSFGETVDVHANPEHVGISVVEIWNERVSAVRERFQNLRTVVLVKSNDLTEVLVFEFDTIRYDPGLYMWMWNKNDNLIGVEKSTGKHRFTWQPHGSQFTIIEEVPNSSLIIKIKQPKTLDKDEVLKTLGFDHSWISVTKRNG